MSHRKRHFSKKEKKSNLIISIVMAFIAIVVGLINPFTLKAKAIADGNIFLTLVPFMIFLALIAILIIGGMMKK